MALVPIVVVGTRLGLVESYDYALRAYAKGDFAAALPFVYVDAFLNDSAACGLLGTMYLFGQGVRKDGRRAEYWLIKAANGNSVEAESLLGLMYATGQGVPIDSYKAQAWLTKAAAAGDVHAQTLLHQIHQGKKT